MSKANVNLDTIVSLAKRRGFVFPGSEIYGGLANSWDYGPLGVQLKKNISDAWWKRFVEQRGDMVGIDPAVIMHPEVWEASGHVQEFTDPLVECRECHRRFRADQVEKQCPVCAGSFTEVKNFNLLFRTYFGSVVEDASVVYLRPELAQAMFVNFSQVLQTSRKRIPFGIASQGKAFRNEITPGNFIFRTREFNLMEFEYFVRESEWEKYFEYWLEEMKKWLMYVGVKEDKIFIHEIPPAERAHYSKRTVDIEYDYPFGRKELYGLAYRSDFDSKNHQEKSGQDLQYADPVTGEKFLPHVIEPTFGLDRTVLVAMLEAYHEEEVKDEKRVVLKFPAWMAPYQVAVLPLMKKSELTKLAEKVATDLRKNFRVEYDVTGSIGKRYRRQDEIGTPYAVTIDYDSLEDKAVTVRDRDSMQQERIKISEITTYLKSRLEGVK